MNPAADGWPGRSRHDHRGALGRADPRGERRALLLQRAHVLERVRLVLLHVRERRSLVAAGRGQLALVPGEPVADGALLGRAGGNLTGDRGDLLAGLPGRVPDLLHLFLRALDLVRDLLVLTSDLVQEVQLIEQLREAGGLEHDAERGCALGRVDLDDALVQPLRRSLVLALQEHELAGLHLVELVQPVELALMQREHGLELVEARRGAVDCVLKPRRSCR